jgi:hypothetical protein
MKPRISPPEAVLAAAVLVHLAVSLVHGVAHARAHVELAPAAMLFVVTVILIGPVLGLIVQRAGLRRAGAWAIAATLAGALVFGVANHFLLPGGDHVSHATGPWRALFGATAAALAVVELVGSAVAVRCATLPGRAS